MKPPLNFFRRTLFVALIATLAAFSCQRVTAINIVLDYSLDTNNNNWFGVTPEGLARRAALDSAAGFLSAIITNDDWSSLPSLNESFSLTDIAASSINDVNGNTLFGTPETDGEGFKYTINTTNRSSVAANEYIIYVAALDFDSGTSAHAKGGKDGSVFRNDAGMANPSTEFNTWGGKIYFDRGDTWYAGQNPGINPLDDYGVQDPEKSPVTDISTDNWDWSTSTSTWKGFDLTTIDPSAAGKLDLYATALHEMTHALGALSAVIEDYVGVDMPTGDFLGANVVAEFGGPVPGAGAHFASDVQSTVWDSDGIISEVTLDPNSLRGNRKYFTKLDVALLKDLGYDVLDTLVVSNLPGDYNNDGAVDATDYTVWLDNLGASITFPGEDSNAATPGFVDQEDYAFWKANFGLAASSTALVESNAVPEPATVLLLLVAAASFTGVRTLHIADC